MSFKRQDIKMTETKTFLWKDGYYHYKSTTLLVFEVKGEKMIKCHPGAYETQLALPPNESLKCKIKQGSYEESTPEIAKIIGKKNYDKGLSLFGDEMIRLHM